MSVKENTCRIRQTLDYATSYTLLLHEKYSNAADANELRERREGMLVYSL